MSFELKPPQTSRPESTRSADKTKSTSSPEAQRLLFVVGLWRSGTSLIHTLLNQHPKIALLYEAELLELWPRNSVMLSTHDWTQRLEFFNQAFSRHRLATQPFTSMRPGPDAAMALYREYARERNALIMGSKAPSYHSRLPMVGKLFPDARFLIIWRDPLECCRSAARAAQNNRFFSQPGLLIRILLGAETLARGVEHLLRNKRSICEVVYDEFTRNPEQELRRICEFLGIPFSPAMLDLSAADTGSVPLGEHHAGVRSGMIGKPEGAEEVLTDAFIAKGLRYAKLWKKRFSQLDFARALHDEAPNPPGPFERFSDFCAKDFWCQLDSFKKFLFRWIPLSWWAWLRSKPR